MIAEMYEELSRSERRSLVLDVAAKCHIHPVTAISYLRGKKKPGPLTAEKMAEVIGRPVNELFTGIAL